MVWSPFISSFSYLLSFAPSFISFSSPSIVLRLFGRPGFRFPGGVHLNAHLPILSTWPSHFSLRRFISWVTLLQPVLRYSSSLDTFLCQKMRQIFLIGRYLNHIQFISICEGGLIPRWQYPNSCSFFLLTCSCNNSEQCYSGVMKLKLCHLHHAV